MNATTLPKGWSVELQGLSASVLFTKDRHQIMWCDGRWQMIVTNERGTHVMEARGIPQASTMKEARRVGTEWLVLLEQEDEA